MCHASGVQVVALVPVAGPAAVRGRIWSGARHAALDGDRFVAKLHKKMQFGRCTKDQPKNRGGTRNPANLFGPSSLELSKCDYMAAAGLKRYGLTALTISALDDVVGDLFKPGVGAAPMARAALLRWDSPMSGRLVGAPRFELGTPSPPDWCANRAALRSALIEEFNATRTSLPSPAEGVNRLLAVVSPPAAYWRVSRSRAALRRMSRHSSSSWTTEVRSARSSPTIPDRPSAACRCSLAP